MKSRLVLPIWYRLTRVVADKGPLNGCVCVCGILTGTGRGAEISRQVPACKRLVPCRQGDGRVGRGESVEQRRRWEDCAGCCVAGHAEPRHSQGPLHHDLSHFVIVPGLMSRLTMRCQCNSHWRFHKLTTVGMLPFPSLPTPPSPPQSTVFLFYKPDKVLAL